MIVKDVIEVRGLGTVVTGTIEEDVLFVGDTVDIYDEEGNTVAVDVRIKGIEKSRKKVQRANEGETVGLLLSIDDITLEKGYVLKL